MIARGGTPPLRILDFLGCLEYSGGEMKECNVWNCSFEIKDGKIVPYGANRPVPNYSRVYICEDEKD